MGITAAQRLCAINALEDPALREMADRVAVCKLLRENPPHATLRDRLRVYVHGACPAVCGFQ